MIYAASAIGTSSKPWPDELKKSRPRDLHAGKAHDAFPVLSKRELEVLELIARGDNNATIARALFLSPKTVRNHISSIFSKVNFADRSDAIVRARAAGMGSAQRTGTV